MNSVYQELLPTFRAAGNEASPGPENKLGYPVTSNHGTEVQLHSITVAASDFSAGK